MALSDIEAQLTDVVPHKTCAVCHWMAERGDEWADKLRGLLSNRGVKFKDLADKLRDDPDEPNIPAQALSRHAQRGCAAQERLR
jgi:hypothetical protein